MCGHSLALSQARWRMTTMGETHYPKQTRHLAETRRALAPEAEAAFHAFGEAVFREGAVSRKTKQLIAVAVALTTRSAEHTYELQSLMRISYAVFCLKKTKHKD